MYIHERSASSILLKSKNEVHSYLKPMNKFLCQVCMELLRWGMGWVFLLKAYKNYNPFWQSSYLRLIFGDLFSLFAFHFSLFAVRLQVFAYSEKRHFCFVERYRTLFLIAPTSRVLPPMRKVLSRFSMLVPSECWVILLLKWWTRLHRPISLWSWGSYRSCKNAQHRSWHCNYARIRGVGV